MKRLLVIVAGVALVATLTAAVSQSESAAPVAGRVPAVRVAEVLSAPTTVEEVYSGRVVSPSEGALSFTVGGRIVDLPVEAGQAVRAGDVIAILDRQAWELAEQEAQAGLARVEVELEQARRDLERTRALGTAVTQEEVEQRLTGVAALDAERRRVLAALSETRRLSREAVLRAPYSGVVTDRFVRVNEVVSPGSPVAQLSGSAGVYEVDILLPESAVGRIALGDEVLVAFPLSDIPELPGRISRISPHASTQGGLFPVKIAVNDVPGLTGGLLRHGIQARVSFFYDIDDALLLVPVSAVVSDPRGGASAYRVAGEVVRETALRVSKLIPEGAVVSGNLDPGDQVVVSGHFTLSDGQAVEVAW
ncbi:MAG: efflux RND transporter periplasmic adaptor subunit [Spirochaetaceae bacterium]